MATPLPSWSWRDLETVSANLLDAERFLKLLTDAPDIANEHREFASDARTSVKVARQFLKLIRAQQEEFLTRNAKVETPET